MRLTDEILKGFYSHRFYYDLAHDGKGIGLRYIVALTVLVTLFMPLYLWQAYPALHPVIKQMPELAKSLPAVTFDGSRISLDRQGPFRTSIGPDNVWVMFDPNYRIVDTDTLAKVLRQSHVVLLLTADKLMIMKDAEGNLEMEDLKWYPSFSISHAGWQVLGRIVAQKGISFYSPIAVVVIFLGVFIYTCLMVLVTACMALVLQWIVRASFNFSAAMRLAAMVRIPATIVTSVPILIGSPLGDTLAALIWWGYLIFAVLSCREKVYSRT